MSEGDPDDPPLRPLMGPVFWALLGFAFVCVVAGIAVAVWGPRLPPEPAPRSQGPP